MDSHTCPAGRPAPRLHSPLLRTGRPTRWRHELVVRSEHRRAELGYWIALDRWNHGVATESNRAYRFGFEVLGLHESRRDTSLRNPASGRVMLKLGMQSRESNGGSGQRRSLRVARGLLDTRGPVARGQRQAQRKPRQRCGLTVGILTLYSTLTNAPTRRRRPGGL